MVAHARFAHSVIEARIKHLQVSHEKVVVSLPVVPVSDAWIVGQRRLCGKCCALAGCGGDLKLAGFLCARVNELLSAIRSRGRRASDAFATRMQ